MSQTICPWEFSDDPTLDASTPNLPTPEGRALGHEVARLCDKEDARLRPLFPKMAQRCSDCAGRAGTPPNGCVETLMDLIKCGVEDVPFLCHQTRPGEEPSKPCQAWVLMQASSEQDPDVTVGEALMRRRRPRP